MSFKSMNYLDTYKKFVESNKVFFVKFYKEYEGAGGYWNEYDIWVSGDTVCETLIEQKFYSIEDALKFANDKQMEFLEQEQAKAEKDSDYWKEHKLYWISTFNANSEDYRRWELIQARINWGGSTIKMAVWVETY